MDLPALIAQFGYLAVFLGTVFEGETVLLLAGYSAHRGYLDFASVVSVAWLGAVAGDQLFFWLGPHHGQRVLGRRPALRVRVERALVLIERHPLARLHGWIACCWRCWQTVWLPRWFPSSCGRGVCGRAG